MTTHQEALEAAGRAAFQKAQSVYRADHDHFPLKTTWETTDESVRDGWRQIADASLLAAYAPALDENAIASIIAPYFQEGYSARDAARALVAALAHRVAGSAIRTYISTLDTSGLVERLRATAAERSRATAADKDHYMNVVARISREDGALLSHTADTITAQAARITALEALVDRAGEAFTKIAATTECRDAVGLYYGKPARSTSQMQEIADEALTAIKEARHAGN